MVKRGIKISRLDNISSVRISFTFTSLKPLLDNLKISNNPRRCFSYYSPYRAPSRTHQDLSLGPGVLSRPHQGLTTGSWCAHSPSRTHQSPPTDPGAFMLHHGRTKRPHSPKLWGTLSVLDKKEVVNAI